MFKSNTMIKGKVTFRVYDEDGNLKRFEPGLVRSLLGISGRAMEIVTHNIVTDEGDALVADQMSDTPSQTKVDGTNGHIEVGTGFTSESKTATSCTTPTGSPEILDTGYPQLKGSFGAADDNVTVYRATFEAGDLNTTGIDEAALLNNASAGAAECLAYAQISPALNVTSSDTLEITWELTFTGS